MTLKIARLRAAHQNYFSKENIRCFDDLEYRILHDKQHQPYLVRLTYGWSDMFGGDRIAHWKINPIGPNLELLSLDARSFRTLADVKKALAESEA
jgi:hypothetical protein